MNQQSYVVIIGVGPGLGLALASKFNEEGMDVCMVARDSGKLMSYADELNAKKGNISAYSADAGNNEAFGNTLDRILEENGAPSAIIYNVSILRPGEPSTIPFNSFVEDFKINVGGLLTTYQHVIGAMKKSGSGKILVTGGGLSLSPFYEFASLGVGKAGLRNLTISLAQESKKWGVEIYTITINGMIEPGGKFDPHLIATKFWDIYRNGLDKNKVEFIFE